MPGWMYDSPLRFLDNTWRGIYAHHLVEHVSYSDAFQLFREYRRMRTGYTRQVSLGC